MTTVNFAQRSMQPELMDSEAVGFAEFHQCLRQLTIVNVLTLAYRPTLRWLGRTARYTMPHDTVSVLDVGSGGGDMLRKIWKLLQRRDLKSRAHRRRSQSLVEAVGGSGHAAADETSAMRLRTFFRSISRGNSISSSAATLPTI